MLMLKLNRQVRIQIKINNIKSKEPWINNNKNNYYNFKSNLGKTF